ncbi:PaaI family thioesterase [Corynebacterium silvaticum]|uniref:PaaI family thioesterase n=1 Tax=Corynebacterium silvaticum TaxID=2320431 RepID=A0A7U5HLS6_9CORY|nr:PaaI family thioesterase [Corynebacterium silvaticum]ARU46123.1 PaaI family thioesterase [Corynebacterium silvaticum]UWH01234.1 PaaI family thioesterase [Corynebacterium silvaticum]UWH03281.1 PaaI family thioesterase [Corynebacterium silvaticum]UWH05317.1 PaaI family thioesterase [Corynebacterium silvaticum]UXZ27481.1 PaaI family thioesterase [Corynebacterium silvaticum]
MGNGTKMLEMLEGLNQCGLSIEQLDEFNSLSEGFSKTLGLRFTEITSQSVKAELPVSDAHLQVSGMVNGGVYSSLAETVGSVAGVIAANGKLVVGANCTTDFLGTVSAGVIYVDAHVIHPGRTSQLIGIDLYHRHKLVARATLRTIVITPQPEAPKKDKFNISAD